MKSKHLWLAAVMAVLALFVHGYLYAQHLALQAGEVTKSLCDINEKFSCTAVSASKYAEILNVPVALWGLMANLAFLILILVLLFSDEDKKPAARRNLLITALAIFAGSVVMGSISVFLMAQFCLFCMTAYVLSILLLLFTWLYVRGESSPIRFGDFKGLLVVAAICFIGAFVVNSSMAQGAADPQTQTILNGYVDEWKATPAKDFKLVDPIVKGPENAKMTIVEFADYRCIHCKHAAPVLHAFVAAHPDVRLEFQPWPLDGECNSSLNQSNGASCLLARSSWCAQKNKASGWAVHDYIYGLSEIYSSVDAVKADLGKIAEAAGMSEAEMRTCTDSDAAKTAVREQANVGTNLNIQGTPTIYVNKKLLSGGQSLPVLQRAYQTL
jgi:protein-disulfide isomerase